MNKSPKYVSIVEARMLCMVLKLMWTGRFWAEIYFNFSGDRKGPRNNYPPTWIQPSGSERYEASKKVYRIMLLRQD